MRQQQQQQQKQQEVQHSAPQMSDSLPGAPHTSNANLSSTSYDQLIDVMGYSGVDLRAEEAFIQQNGSSWEDSHTASAIHAAGLVHGLYLNVYPGSPNILVTDKRYLYGSPAYGRSGTTAFAGKIKDAVVIADVEKKVTQLYKY